MEKCRKYMYFLTNKMMPNEIESKIPHDITNKLKSFERPFTSSFERSNYLNSEDWELKNTSSRTHIKDKSISRLSSNLIFIIAPTDTSSTKKNNVENINHITKNCQRVETVKAMPYWNKYELMPGSKQKRTLPFSRNGVLGMHPNDNSSKTGVTSLLSKLQVSNNDGKQLY